MLIFRHRDAQILLDVDLDGNTGKLNQQNVNKTNLERKLRERPEQKSKDVIRPTRFDAEDQDISSHLREYQVLLRTFKQEHDRLNGRLSLFGTKSHTGL